MKSHIKMWNNELCSVAWNLGYLLHVRTVCQLINPSTALGMLSHWSAVLTQWSRCPLLIGLPIFSHSHF